MHYRLDPQFIRNSITRGHLGFLESRFLAVAEEYGSNSEKFHQWLNEHSNLENEIILLRFALDPPEGYEVITEREWDKWYQNYREGMDDHQTEE